MNGDLLLDVACSCARLARQCREMAELTTHQDSKAERVVMALDAQTLSDRCWALYRAGGR